VLVHISYRPKECTAFVVNIDSAWSWVRIFVFLRVNGGVVHGLGYESLTFGGGNGGVDRSSWVRILKLFGGQW
jgi:hypothetical protein